MIAVLNTVIAALTVALLVTVWWTVKTISRVWDGTGWWRRSGKRIIYEAERGCAWFLILVTLCTMLGFIVWGIAGN